MRFLRKLFKRNKKEKKEDCWYNNFHEQTKTEKGEPLEGVALSSPNMAYYTSAKSNTESSR